MKKIIDHNSIFGTKYQGRSQTFDRGGAKGGAIENVLGLEKFAKILDLKNFE